MAIHACVLTLNAGSSSLKAAVFAGARLVAVQASRIGTDAATMTIATKDGSPEIVPLGAADHTRALDAIVERISAAHPLADIAAIGHRVVHGGARHREATRVTPELLADLARLAPLDPDHLPAEIAILHAMRARAPSLPQVACFDTAFHRTMPRVSRLLPLPRRYEDLGVVRYGFHGLSYTFLMEELARRAGAEAARGRVVLAHLGSGASLAAVKGGECVDTTMSFTPNSGIMMGTRTGDLDPGVLLHVLRTERLDVDALDALLSKRSGLLGVSESSADMRDLLLREASDGRAADAVALFCHTARKAIGALATTIGGVETLVFAGGIGEHSAPVRARVAHGLEHLGVAIDDAKNAASAPVISADASKCAVHVIATDEESIIARETLRHVAKTPGGSP